MKRIFKLLFLPILSIALFVYVYTNQIQPKLGLDLQGGISVILTADEGTDKELIEQAVEIMRTRIAAFGEVQEPEISISGENSVLVQLPGITDQEKALQAVGTTGLLTFRPVLNSSLNIGYSPALDITQDPDDPDNPIVNAPEGVDPITGITIDDNPNDISYLLSIRDGYPVIYELGPAELSGSDIKDALAVYPQNEWIVQLVLKEDSVQKFTDLTKKLASLSGEQRKLAIVLDNEVISAPGIAIDVDPNTGITGDTAAISMGNADQGESANNLAVVLRYGALPVSFERSSIQKVSATLGENTLNLGLQAGFVGLVIVSFFLLIYYRLNGLVAILGLSSFGALFYSVIALLGEFQGYTLTLAGIAGVIVSIGLTADSYIVIFEKLKDELKVGRSFNFATEKAVKEAWNTILVADFVSIIASVILYILAVGPIRGFALTLGVATVFDLFYTRLFIGNAVPSLGSITINPRFFYPLTQKDIADV
jgi:protein-export membrane protein SecD|tara:strand:- start:70 stop:1515 length:1446 start_codon:yes stop_codon:yes gene_type:complete